MAEKKPSEVRVGPQGRLVIPASLRRELGIVIGEKLIARAKDGQLVLERPEMVVERLKSTFDNLPAGVSLVDELVAERKEEASRESEG